jgi:N-acetylglutamate synthase
VRATSAWARPWYSSAPMTPPPAAEPLAAASLRIFELVDHAAAVALWRQSEGVVLREVDGREAIGRYLARNPGLSFVAELAGCVVGTVLCGTDGRRGYLQHLAVASSHRRRGLGRALAERAVAALAAQGIEKCHLMVLVENAAARAFWAALGWDERADVRLLSRTASLIGDA